MTRRLMAIVRIDHCCQRTGANIAAMVALNQMIGLGACAHNHPFPEIDCYRLPKLRRYFPNGATLIAREFFSVFFAESEGAAGTEFVH